MYSDFIHKAREASPRFWRAATLGTPAWMVITLASTLPAAAVVDDIAGEGHSPSTIVFYAVVVVSVLGVGVAFTLSKRTSEAWRGFALGIATASVIALVFTGIGVVLDMDALGSVTR
jgi:hypothetical protein